MSHPGQGLPHELIQDMVGGGQQWTSEQGLALNLSRRLLNKLNGNVRYVREQTKCYFLIDLELKLRRLRGIENPSHFEPGRRENPVVSPAQLFYLINESIRRVHFSVVTTLDVAAAGACFSNAAVYMNEN
uniref:Uncharacterized protein n=1 Tax=Cucumis sativus TaxID=3659 RepID=A0A0A0LUI4_CUCSA